MCVRTTPIIPWLLKTTPHKWIHQGLPQLRRAKPANTDVLILRSRHLAIVGEVSPERGGGMFELNGVTVYSLRVGRGLSSAGLGLDEIAPHCLSVCPPQQCNTH